MKNTKKNVATPKLTGEQIIKKKLDEANTMLQKIDLSQLTAK